jgi:uncharacterized membrane protein YozB (DUF420 family)
MSSAMIFQIQSALIVLLMLFGISKHRQRNLHAKIMFSAIIWDILLILQIEFTRDAIAKASKTMANPMILNIHILLALTTVLHYFFMLYSGKKVLKGDNSRLAKHRLFGKITMSLRILTFITSFFAVN